MSLDDPPRAIVITSSNPSEGKSTVVSNLGRVLAQAGQPVLIIDGDLRRPMQHKEFGLDSRIGLTEVLTGDLHVDEAIQQTDAENLYVLTAGRIPPNPSEVTGSQQMVDLIERLKQDYFVLIDAPPLLPVTDAGLLAGAADGALLVIRVGKTYKEQVEAAAETLKHVGAKLLGTVLNGATKRNMGEVVYGYGKGYAYGQTYYYTYEEGMKKRKKKALEGPASVDEAREISEGARRFDPYQPGRAADPADLTDDEPFRPDRPARAAD